jgi:hypothetical protein
MKIRLQNEMPHRICAPKCEGLFSGMLPDQTIENSGSILWILPDDARPVIDTMKLESTW